MMWFALDPSVVLLGEECDERDEVTEGHIPFDEWGEVRFPGRVEDATEEYDDPRGLLDDPASSGDGV